MSLLLARFAWPIAGLLLAASVIGVEEWRIAGLKADLSAEQAKASDIRAAGFQAGLERTAEDARNLKTANDAISEALENAQKSAAQARADADAAGSALQRLRQRVADSAARGRCPTSAPATARGGTPATTTTDLQPDVLGRVGEAARQLAAYADSAANAGLACSAYADSLEPLR